jgi:Galactose oxidase, central domain
MNRMNLAVEAQMKGASTSPRPSRVTAGVALLLVLVSTACGSDAVGPPSQPGSDDPNVVSTAKRSLVGPGGKILQRETYQWDSHDQEWKQKGFSRGPGVSSGTVARAIHSIKSSQGLSPSRQAMDEDLATAAFFAGGFGPNGAPAGNQAYYYDGDTDTWTDFQMAQPRVDHTLTALSDGSFLIVGGNDATPEPTATAEIFDPQGMRLASTGSMAEARWGHAASLLLDGRVLITGGQGASGSPVLMAELFDPTTGQFSPAGLLNEPRVEHTQVTLDDGRVIVIGGSGRNTAELWDPATGTFTFAGDMASIHGIGHTATKLPNGRVLVLGGDGSSGHLEPTDVAEIFDPTSNAFTSAGTMTSVRLEHFAVLMDGGEVLIGGGIDDSGFPTATAEIYDASAGSFTKIPDMPAAGEAQAAVFVAVTDSGS